MRILIVEDIEAKMKVIEECISGVREDWEFIEAMSYSDGLQKIYRRLGFSFDGYVTPNL